jgi:soluble lytic murein transglycosylase-like protein
MKSALFFALLEMCTIWFGNHGRVLHKRIRNLGGERYLLRVDENIRAVADLTHVSPFLIAKLAHEESGLDPSNYNKTTRASGLMQLMPNTPHWREWRRICALSPADCNQANLLIGARELLWAWRLCGGGWELAVARYRGNGCVARDIDVGVVEEAERLRTTSIQRMLTAGAR